MVLRVIYGFLKNVDVTFFALQKADARICQQLCNLGVLKMKLVVAARGSVDEAFNEAVKVAMVVAGPAIQMCTFILSEDTTMGKIFGTDLWVLETLKAPLQAKVNVTM